MEALAAKRALELAHETGFTNGVLEGDSQVLIGALRTDSHKFSQFSHIVNNIRYLASHFSNLSYSHVWRYYNTVTHSLMRQAISFSSLQVWMKDVPQEIADVFQTNLHIHSS